MQGVEDFMILITGGSGSGKSEYAEETALRLKKELFLENMIYIATMLPIGEETLNKIEKHRKMRKNKGFFTKECYKTEDIIKINGLDRLKKSVVLLECMSNLAANEIFSFKNEKAFEDIVKGMKNISEKSGAFIIVTNEVFSDGMEYDMETLKYMECLGKINCALAGFAEEVTEVVCGIPVIYYSNFGIN